jgi:hypothetical protein
MDKITDTKNTHKFSEIEPTGQSTSELPSQTSDELMKKNTSFIKSPIFVAMISFFLIGSGHLFLGQIKKGLTLFISTLLINWRVGTIAPIVPAVILILVIGDAYGVAKKIRNGGSVGEWEFNIHWGVAILAGLIYFVYAVVIPLIFFSLAF